MEGAEVSAQVDELLESLAHQYSGTRFVRVRPQSSLCMSLQIYLLPALACFREGSLVGTSAGLGSCGGAEDFREELATKWLAKCGMLEGWVNPNADESEEEEDGECEACVECGRTYYHEHIRAVKPSGLSLKDSDDDDDDDE
eukprot:CAMPEP_0197852800 /NCGR_PEP_ID=MMETSP1438-20131217/21426_1 /TAXON_ID=1461541 /ORGANISM="Pterosperma sp., Strain CCMP1384" /LENGTH=141 /DNA_ID=CAMNT_0043466987 /DNA_START=45 /DNA_END=470 /DNA_ORIENTATION=+